MTTYGYTFSDTANGQVNADKLDAEITDAGPWSVNFDGVVVKPAPQIIEVRFDDPGLNAGEVTTLNGIIAAHQGEDTVTLTAAVRDPFLVQNPAGSFIDVLRITTPPLTKGWYKVVCSTVLRTQAAPTTPFTDFAEARFSEDENGGGASAIGGFAGLFDRDMPGSITRMVFAQHGDVFEWALELRRQGTAVAEARDSVISVEPFDGRVELNVWTP